MLPVQLRSVPDTAARNDGRSWILAHGRRDPPRELDPLLREVVILRIGFLSKASYEVHQHKRVARKVGMSDEKIAALEHDPQSAVLDKPAAKAAPDASLKAGSG